jgi:hypothetical protein
MIKATCKNNRRKSAQRLPVEGDTPQAGSYFEGIDITRADKMRVEAGVGGAADPGERKPGATEGSGAFTVLLCEVVAYTILFYTLFLY